MYMLKESYDHNVANSIVGSYAGTWGTVDVAGGYSGGPEGGQQSFRMDNGSQGDDNFIITMGLYCRS